MDANTKDVLMALIALISAVVTPLIVLYVNNKTIKRIEANSKSLAIVENKLDENHKQQNGNLTILLETTKSLATATEKARAESETKNHKK